MTCAKKHVRSYGVMLWLLVSPSKTTHLEQLARTRSQSKNGTAMVSASNSQIGLTAIGHPEDLQDKWLANQKHNMLAVT